MVCMELIVKKKCEGKKHVMEECHITTSKQISTNIQNHHLRKTGNNVISNFTLMFQKFQNQNLFEKKKEQRKGNGKGETTLI